MKQWGTRQDGCQSDLESTIPSWPVAVEAHMIGDRRYGGRIPPYDGGKTDSSAMRSVLGVRIARHRRKLSAY